MRNILNQNYLRGKSLTSLHALIAAKSENETGTETEIETERETETEIATKISTESFPQTPALKAAVEESITPEAGATEERTAAEAEAAADAADRSIRTESRGPALTCPLQEAPLLFGTERRVKRAVKVQTWR